MSEKVQKNAPPSQEKEAPEAVAKDLHNEELDAATEDLMDEIDGLLEEARGEQSVEEFVTSFVQRGGE
jgi:ubiquitin-like protein Pup